MPTPDETARQAAEQEYSAFPPSRHDNHTTAPGDRVLDFIKTVGWWLRNLFVRRDHDETSEDAIVDSPPGPKLDVAYMNVVCDGGLNTWGWTGTEK
jgi:hypothetical protein